jgi:hypothetical protein
MRPDWLPPSLTFTGADFKRDCERLHAIYQDEILAAQLNIEGIPVVLNNVPDPDFPPYTFGFTHLITRDNGAGFRALDYNRACKLSWIVPIVQNYKDPSVSCFWYAHPKGETLVVWLEDHDYLLVLKWLTKAQTKRILVTSYSVDVRNKRYYQRLRSRPTSRPL